MSKVDIKEKLNAVPNVVIEEGTFKYIQIRISFEDEEKIIIRGSDLGYHADIFDECSPSIIALGFKTDCIGGGRIMHDPVGKIIQVYGYSMGFGRADHKITVKYLKEAYPGYNITWSNEGY